MYDNNQLLVVVNTLIQKYSKIFNDTLDLRLELRHLISTLEHTEPKIKYDAWLSCYDEEVAVKPLIKRISTATSFILNYSFTLASYRRSILYICAQIGLPCPELDVINDVTHETLSQAIPFT
ncbi:hypothetical protein C1645_827920 [Glomus cerebriforme]|uniref:Uncharacterized protein n=1 Tax=Glomus cerebriforme TaxID=658196 RepID=A0A397SMA7_9GLOM|nr:hypothetical protein C1645_827920 [Glomus cerebriforme]